MNPNDHAYAYRRQVTLAGLLALCALATAGIYEWHSTPHTMVLFLMGGSTLLLSAAILYGWVLWRDLRSRLQSLAPMRFAPGQQIFHQGDVAEHVFVITKGKVEAVFSDPAKGDVVLGHLGPEEFFGEAAILSRLPRQATARALDEVELLAIHRTDFLRLYGSLPRLRARIEAQPSRHRMQLSRPGAEAEGPPRK
jgi:CRP-like cAMP-binding protein